MVAVQTGSFRSHGEVYLVAYWIGPSAPANERVAILRALESIRPASLKTLK